MTGQVDGVVTIDLGSIELHDEEGRLDGAVRLSDEFASWLGRQQVPAVSRCAASA